MGFEAKHDTFDTAMIEIKNEHWEAFIDELNQVSA